MTTRATPIGVAERELRRWRERQAKLQQQLWDVQEHIEQWETIHHELTTQGRDHEDPTPSEIEGVAS